MARNKYPEITVEKILDVAQRLFLEKGYDNTTIQDIVNELGGLTKGAIYHHFKSKEEIIDALSDKMFFDNNPFTLVKQKKKLNGLQKMREVIKINYEDTARSELSKHTLPVLKNPRILAGMIDTDKRLIAPLWLQLIEEAQRDGSIKTVYAKELSELIPLLSDLWISPTIYPSSKEEVLSKIDCLSAVLEAMGLPLFDEETKRLVKSHVEELFE